MLWINNSLKSWGSILCFLLSLVSSKRLFTIDYQNNCFLKDGEPFTYVSGSIHYFRVPWQYWPDRLAKMKAAGLNTLQTYVEWNHHEPEPGVYNFEENYDLAKFLQTAQDLDMLVILRTGPFIDAERDMGGLPYWLLRVDPNMKLRTYDANYIKYMDRWYSVLLPKIRPFLYNNGGPIITVQIENEYGSLGVCDAQYTTHLRDLFRHFLGDSVVLFTTDGCVSNAIRCGKVDEVFSTLDFGTGANVTSIFDMLRWHQSSGPLVNSEFYPGWLDHWGEPHASVSDEAVTKTLSDILSTNASVNIYMFHGGTSFGFSAGSNLGGTFQPCPTSYDYDAPLSEAGDPTSKYYEIRKTIGQFMPLPPVPVPVPAPKMKLKPVTMQKVADIFEVLKYGDEDIVSPYPLSFEDIKQPFGFVMYSASVNFTTYDPVLLSVPDIRDRGYVFVNKKFQGILSREQKIYSMPLKTRKGQDISILVENQGRVCFGGGVNDRKGIVQNVTLGSRMLVNWTMNPVVLNSETLTMIEVLALERENIYSSASSLSVPAFYTGTFILEVAEPLDTFLRLDGWHKGVAFLNGFNLGRYWPIVGPQITLYVPGVLFKKPPQLNSISLLELEHAPCKDSSECLALFVDIPVVNGTTPTVKTAFPLFQKPQQNSRCLD